ncbi:MAG TPA: PAS domain-containing sensor histidine kinase [Thermoanaerobaculia bacterium]|nr:PAS domain-containing sensor histidine kinase [Thermoanaerobaculia bacterium]
MRPSGKFAAWFGGFAAAAGLLALAGWAFHLPRLTSWDNSVSQMPNSAIGIIAAGLGLICWSLQLRRVSAALGAFTALLAMATLFEHATAIDLGIDRLVLFREWGQRGTMAPGRMGVPGSLSLLILGGALLLRNFRRTENAGVTGGVLAMGIATLSLIGYFFRADPLYAIPRFTAIAMQTSLQLFCLGAGLVASVADRPPLSHLYQNSAAAMLVRRALPWIIAIPILLGWLSLYGQRARLFDTPFGTALLVLVLIALFAFLLARASKAIATREAASAESERKFSLLFQKAAFGGALSRLPEGTFIDVNEGFEQLFGISRDEAIGRTSVELGINRDVSTRAEFLEQLTRESFLRDQELTLFTKSGERKLCLCNLTLIELEGQTYLLTTLQDITQRKAAEDALRAADRMKDEFLATLSHELRTPLTSIIGWSQMFLKLDVNPRDRRVGLESIRSSAMAQAKLIDDILDVSAITTGKMRVRREEIDLCAAIDAAVATVTPAAEAKRITLQLKLDRSIPPHLADPDRIQQIVWNLLSNAIKFSPKGSTVTVELRSEQESTAIDIIDEGPGIPSALLPYIFERFRQGDSSSTRPQAGLGIGLALAKSLAEIHGGGIDVESEVGRGTRFTVRLPAPAAAAVAHDLA